jgi:hypothetical protein
MIEFRQLALLAALLLAAAAHVAAQTISTTPTDRNSDGKIISPEPTETPAINTAVKPRPDRVERALPQEIRDKVKQFETAREAFIRREEELRKRADGATTEKEREAIRARIRENLERWREQARQFREEAKDRAKELQRELPNHREALDDTPRGKPGRPGRPGLD